LQVWQEFWITGDCNGRGVEPSDPQWPLDHDLFLKCAWDTVKLLRNYASLALWVGGNEQQPADDINDALTLGLALHSRNGNPSLCLDGTRAYIKGSLWEGFAAGNGLFRDGPYGIQVPERFFQENYYPYAFNPEIGNVGVPVAATIRATMPPEAWDPPQILDGEIPNPTWFYHKFIAYSDEQNLVPGQIESYGVPEGLDDFCEKAQLVNYVQYRALIEGWNSWMWTHYTGMLIWKTQNPWPGLRGQMYDHLLDQTGAFFGIRCAAEPIHVQLNLLTYSIEAINTRKDQLSGFSVKATMYDIEGAIVYTNTIEHLTLPAYMTVSVGKVPLFESPNTQPVYFVLLKLLDSSGALVSRNFYWVHPTPGSYALLSGAFREQKVHIKTTTQVRLTGRLSYSISIYVENPSKVGDQQKDAGVGDVRDGVAFGLQFSVRNVNSKAQDNRILPVTYSHNWFSLVPGEALTVEVLFVLHDTKVHPKLLLRGWNVSEISIAL
jgi:mannosylglycoprotein endo-beta-mannosidase